MDKSRWSYVFSCLIIVFVAAVVLSLGGYVYMTVNAPTQSVVFVRSPQNGERLEAGEPVQVRALARDDHKITRIELWVDGQLVEAETTNTQSGINPFPLLTVWYPDEGAHTLIVRSFNSRNITSQSTINVEAVTSPDWDQDGAADEVDACPHQPGFSAAGGCPDRDFDGIPDESDACPDETGFPEDGCPAPSEGDHDGDGTLDEADACPDVPGSPLAEGCLDGDGDGVADDRDACPEEPGDGEDGCAEKGGGGYEEPETVGVAPPEPFPGSEAPVPGDDELPEGGSGYPDWGFPIGLPIVLELEALEMTVYEDYERIVCYAQLYERRPRPYEFEPLGNWYWDIAAELGGENSETFTHPDDEDPLPITVWCYGFEGSGEMVDLGRASGEYYRVDWTGEILSLFGYEREIPRPTFDIRFRICEISCDGSPVQAPILFPVISNPFGGGHLIRWRWDDGGIGGWDQFRLERYVNGSLSDVVDFSNIEMRFMGVSYYAPACGEVVEFRMQVLGADDVDGYLRTPWSNTVSWEGEPCSYTASVNFRILDVHSPPRDEGGHRRPGPIYGDFRAATGSAFTPSSILDFDACYRPRHGACRGLKLDRGTHLIAGIFDWIDTQKVLCGIGSCDANSYDAPLTTRIYLPVTEGGDIWFGGLIMDCDKDNPDDVLFRGMSSYRINVAELDYLEEEIPIVIHDDHVDLHVVIRISTH
jgi:hypothetical protein